MANTEQNIAKLKDEVENDENDENKLRLKIQPQPPKFPFVDHPFETSIYLVDAADHLKRGLRLPLKIELLLAEKLVPLEKNILHIDSDPCINAEGICKLKMRISQCSMNHGNRKFIISVTPKQLGSDDVIPVNSNELMVVKHRLVIQGELPEIWYKDEGGRDKCMVLPVHLVDANNNRVCNREVRLKVTLLYENEHYVTKQDILKLSPDIQRLVDRTGEAFIRFRIEDVSKNHQGQAFCIKVEADTQHSPLNFDVSSDVSSSISVRSKRNKRARTKLSPSNTTGQAQTMYGSAPQAVVGIPSSATTMPPQADAGGITITEEAKRRVRDAVASMSGYLNSAHPGSVNGAMSGIIQWAANVVNGLHALEWQVIGHESKTDGTPDHSRPLYRCPSCWRYKDVLSYHTAQHGTNCVIANILMSYATETMVHLHTVLKAIDTISSDQNSGYGTGQSHYNEAQIHQMQEQSRNTQMPLGGLQQSTSNSTEPPSLSRGISDIVGSLDMPSLLRGTSSGLNDLMNSLSGNNSLNFGNQSLSDNFEQRVYYVVAKIHRTRVGGALGFPAFDQHQQLVGYYQEGQDNATTEVIFISLNDVQSSLTQQDLADAQQLFVTEAKSNSGAVLSLPKCDNNLIKLKEDTLMYHWSNNTREMNSMSTNLTWM